MTGLSQSGDTNSDVFQLLIRPEGTGWRVTVMDAGRRGVATSIENSAHEAAAIGVGLWNRWKAAHDVR